MHLPLPLFVFHVPLAAKKTWLETSCPLYAAERSCVRRGMLRHVRKKVMHTEHFARHQAPRAVSRHHLGRTAPTRRLRPAKTFEPMNFHISQCSKELARMKDLTSARLTVETVVDVVDDVLRAGLQEDEATLELLNRFRLLRGELGPRVHVLLALVGRVRHNLACRVRVHARE